MRTLIGGIVALAIGAGASLGVLAAHGDFKPRPAPVARRRAPPPERRVAVATSAAQPNAGTVTPASASLTGSVTPVAAPAPVAPSPVAPPPAPTVVASVERRAPSSPFGKLAIRSVNAGALSIDAGGARAKGAQATLELPGKTGSVAIKGGGNWTVTLAYKTSGSDLVMTADVSPMAIVMVDGVAVGTHASDVNVGKDPVKLEFKSPGADQFGLVIQHKK